MTKIICNFCNKYFGIKTIVNHLPECITSNVKDESGFLIEFKSTSILTNKIYTMYAIFGNKCKLIHIDHFLREKWCECCGHLSTIEEVGKVDSYSDNDSENYNGINYNTLISKYEKDKELCYSYDMGTTTIIYFRIIKKLNGKKKDNNVKLIYQNEEFKLKCKNHKTCKGEAKFIHNDYLFCIECKNIILNTNEDHYESKFVNIVNSPRTGLCDYGYKEDEEDDKDDKDDKDNNDIKITNESIKLNHQT